MVPSAREGRLLFMSRFDVCSAVLGRAGRIVSRKHGEERSCTRLPLGFGGFNRTDYRSAAKRTLRSACDTNGRTAGRLISCQNFESVADCILSQW